MAMSPFLKGWEPSVILVTRGFSKVDHSANIVRIVLVDKLLN